METFCVLGSDGSEALPRAPEYFDKEKEED
jgi:hypothetical protein